MSIQPFGRKKPSFLEDFFEGKAKKGSDRSVESKFTIVHDRWDNDDYERIHSEIKDFGIAERDLKKVAGEPATAAMADEFYSLVKARPVIKDPKQIRPSHAINARIMQEQMKLTEYESLRATSQGDPIGAGLASIAMEPHLEKLYDQLEEERKMAEEMEKMMQEHQDLQDQAEDLDEMIEEAMGQAQGDGKAAAKAQQQAQNYQEQKELIEEAQRRLEEQIQGKGEELDKKLDAQASQIRQELNKGLREANEEADQQSALNTAWGLDRGTLQKMPAEQRLELANRMKNEKFKRLAELIGPMMRMAWAAQARKINYVPEEIYDVEMGNNLTHMLPTEYTYLHHPVLRMDWMRRFVDRQLFQYALRGNEKVAKGGIIFCEDGSGSMHGQPEIWAKAVGLALLHVAKSQKRPFTGIHFGSPGEVKTFKFDTTESEFKSETEYDGHIQHLHGVNSVIDFAELFFGGGTDFVTPLSKALDQLRDEHMRYGAVKGDIVFVTDGMCGVPDAWLAEFKEEQARLGFRVFGIVIGGHRESEPLWTIADGKVLEVKDLLSGNEISSIFEKL